MSGLAFIATGLAVPLGVAYSYLGERYILVRLFKRSDLPKLFGGQEFTRHTLRFAWHLTTLAWLGFAALLVSLAQPGGGHIRVIDSLWARVKLNYREQWRVLVQAIQAGTATPEVGAVETNHAYSA